MNEWMTNWISLQTDLLASRHYMIGQI